MVPPCAPSRRGDLRSERSGPSANNPSGRATGGGANRVAAWCHYDTRGGPRPPANAPRATRAARLMA